MLDPISRGIDDLGNSLLQALNNVQGLFGKELSVANPIKESILQMIGNTPLIKLNKIGADFSNFQFFLKAEFLNPTGSAKDRTALALVADAERKSKLKPGMKIYLANAGSGARSYAWIGKLRGYPVVCYVTLQTPKEKIQSLRAYGAEVIVTNESVPEKVELLVQEKSIQNQAWVPREEDNLANPNFHYKTTGPEIWRDLKGQIDAVVSSPGTGGAITGIGRYLKSQNPEIQIILAGKEQSPFLQLFQNKTKEPPPLPPVFDPLVVDLAFPVLQEEAVHFQSDLYEKEGIFVGMTTGRVVSGALKYAESQRDKKWEGGKFRNIVLLSPDRD